MQATNRMVSNLWSIFLGCIPFLGIWIWECAIFGCSPWNKHNPNSWVDQPGSRPRPGPLDPCPHIWLQLQLYTELQTPWNVTGSDSKTPEVVSQSGMESKFLFWDLFRLTVGRCCPGLRWGQYILSDCVIFSNLPLFAWAEIRLITPD